MNLIIKNFLTFVQNSTKLFLIFNEANFNSKRMFTQTLYFLRRDNYPLLPILKTIFCRKSAFAENFQFFPRFTQFLNICRKKSHSLFF